MAKNYENPCNRKSHTLAPLRKLLYPYFDCANYPICCQCHVPLNCLLCTPSLLCRIVSLLAGNVRWFHFQHEVTISRLSFFSSFRYLMAPWIIGKNSSTLSVYLLFCHHITLVYGSKFKLFLLNLLKLTSSKSLQLLVPEA